MVNGISYPGGFVGYNWGTIRDCYSMGAVTGSISVGGFVGISDGDLVHCYSTGPVYGIETSGGFIAVSFCSIYDCFWDLETSEIDGSDGGEGKTTSQMMSESTFLEAGWDFDTIWSIADGLSYPYLQGIDYGLPLITTEDIGVAQEDTYYSAVFDVISVLPGCEALYWDIATNAGDWLTLSENGTLEGFPGNDDVGTYWVEIILNDPRWIPVSKMFELTVMEVNDPPQIYEEEDQFVNEDELYEHNFYAEDIDSNYEDFIWELSTDAEWLVLEGDYLHGTPRNEDVGTFGVNVTVHDGEGGQDSVYYELTVYNTNDDPMIISENVLTATEDELFWVQYEADDIDPTNDTMEWELSTGAEWLSMNSTTGVLSGTPSNDHVGKHYVDISVHDGNGGYNSTSFELMVHNTNDPPFWDDLPGDVNETEGEDIYLWISADDIDFNDTIVYGISSSPESSIRIDPENGYIQWENCTAGTYSINVSATDGTETIWYTFNIYINALPIPDDDDDVIVDDDIVDDDTADDDIIDDDTADDDDSERSLFSASYLGIAGAVCGAILLLMVIAVILIAAVLKRRRGTEEEDTSEEEEEEKELEEEEELDWGAEEEEQEEDFELEEEEIIEKEIEPPSMEEEVKPMIEEPVEKEIPTPLKIQEDIDLEIPEDATVVIEKGGRIKTIEEYPKKGAVIHSDEVPGFLMMKRIGKGGFSEVYLAKDEKKNRKVALKIPSSSLFEESAIKQRKRFMHEAQNWDDICKKTKDHSGIVKIYSYGLEPIPYISMEYMGEGTLRDYMDDLSVEEKVEIVCQILDTLQIVHGMGIIHRDIKPENIMMNSKGQWKIADWGLSKLLMSSSGSTTKAGNIKATLSYAAPEQIDSDTYGKADSRTDLYQVGVLAYELLTGTRPFVGEPTKIIFSVVSRRPMAPRSIDQRIPSNVSLAIMKALEKKKENRWKKAIDFKNALTGEK
ncbi:MAG: protein kinase domain-containing protein [Thermoplasmatota archaeon]